jgi:DNA invertase Pin-like site-specific DNA recombinase
MVFTVLGAVAELDRNLIDERVRAGLRHAQRVSISGVPRSRSMRARYILCEIAKCWYITASNSAEIGSVGRDCVFCRKEPGALDQESLARVVGKRI